MRLALTFVGKIIGLLGAVAVIAALAALASDDPVGSRLAHFAWLLAVGGALLAAGFWLMRRGKHHV